MGTLEMMGDEGGTVASVAAMARDYRQAFHGDRVDSYEVQCAPLHEILAASNVSWIDLWSLDVEGDEHIALETMDWHIPVYAIIVETSGQNIEREHLVRALLRFHGFERLRGIGNMNELWINRKYETLKTIIISSASPNYSPPIVLSPTAAAVATDFWNTLTGDIQFDGDCHLTLYEQAVLEFNGFRPAVDISTAISSNTAQVWENPNWNQLQKARHRYAKSQKKAKARPSKSAVRLRARGDRSADTILGKAPTFQY